jgi:hypothetical protein
MKKKRKKGIKVWWRSKIFVVWIVELVTSVEISALLGKGNYKLGILKS